LQKKEQVIVITFRYKFIFIEINKLKFGNMGSAKNRQCKKTTKAVDKSV